MSLLFSLTARQAASRASFAHQKLHLKCGMLNTPFVSSIHEVASPASSYTVRHLSSTTHKRDDDKSTFKSFYTNRAQMPNYTPLSALFSPESHGQHLIFRSLHTSPSRFDSKAEESLEAIKDAKKKDAPAKSETAKAAAQAAEDPLKAKAVSTPAPPKLPIRTRIVNELKHYYHGFRLLFIDVKVAVRLIWSVINGKTLMRRERKQLVRTTADLFRLVPFLVFVIVPFAEFLLPVVLKFFPGMLPSTFKEATTEQEKLRKRLKLKLEMAKFLQDTIEETALERKDGKGDNVHEFANFMNKIRASGGQTSNEDILKFSKLFEDEITLDNLNSSQLRAMCKLLEITPVGPSYILRLQLEMKLRELEADDKMIQREGLDSMAVWELQDACRQRGMRSYGVPEERLRVQMGQWLDLHLDQKIPTSLLLLSRTLYFPEHLSTEDQLKATILALPETLTDEAKVKLSEVSGDRIDNKSKLEVIRQEEELILKEKMELDEGLAKAPVEKPSLDPYEDKNKIHTKDLEQFEDALDMVVESKQKLKPEIEDLKALKEEFSEYKESVNDIKEMQGETPSAPLEESKAARRLSKKVEQMISTLDESVSKLSAEPETADGKKEKKEMRVGDNIPDLSAKELLEKQSSLITVTELLSALEKMQVSKESSSKYEIIAKVLDADQDGLIDYNEALRLVELLGQENLTIDPDQMSKIVKVLKKEQQVLEGEKLQKHQEHQQAYHVPEIPVQPTSSKESVKTPFGMPKK